jgi:predicted GNAT superfamily acetyltransferase
VTTAAWALARRAAEAAGVDLRPLETVEDGDRIARVAEATWGHEQPVPREMVRALAESGNVTYGAFADAELIGYVLGWAGVDAREGLHLHSHMLAAAPDRRHRGVGYALKLAQRAQALDQGIELVRWTFDPLVARNAYFNLHKLGAVVDRFERAFYGEMTDALNRGDRSDRFVVRWDLRCEPGSRLRRAPAGRVVLRRGDDEAPARGTDVPGDAAIVEIPAEHAELRETGPELARAWRDAVAETAEACLARGLVGAEFLRGRSAYVFARVEDLESPDTGSP